jgi:hypothetical protein
MTTGRINQVAIICNQNTSSQHRTPKEMQHHKRHASHKQTTGRRSQPHKSRAEQTAPEVCFLIFNCIAGVADSLTSRSDRRFSSCLLVIFLDMPAFEELGVPETLTYSHYKWLLEVEKGYRLDANPYLRSVASK